MGGEIAKTNNMCPNAQDVALGIEISKLQALASELRTDHATFKAAVDSLRTLANELKTDHNALLVKLDADTGVNDTNYGTLHTTAANASAAPATITAAAPSNWT